MPAPVPNRRQFFGLAAAGGLAAALPLLHALPAQATGTAQTDGARAAWLEQDAIARTYHRLLLRHTRWSETQWDAGKNRYTVTDFGFAVVLGNALLLTRDGYDATEAGIDQATLRSRTLATITHYAASNRLAGGTEWGKKLFFDTTFQSYFVLAARLLWSELDAPTRANIETIAREQAQFTTSLGTGDDPASGSWTPNGAAGGWIGDTKLEEMGVYAQSLAPGLAWSADDPRAGAWRERYGFWSRNEAGLPPADLANPTLVDGVAVSANTAHNIYDTFVVENHLSFGPHYQAELWRTSGRNSVHFITAGEPLPEVLTRQPNGDPLWHSLLAVMSDAGEPLMPMVDDREHLYGRDVIPLAFLAQVCGDRYAARAEADLADRLPAYLDYPPVYRLTKFSGEPKYEPEARAELAISFLLHEWRARQGDPVSPASAAEMFDKGSGAVDFGTGPGLLAHQSRGAWAGTVTKPGFIKFAWQPEHDDWLFSLGGSSPMFLPSTSATVTARVATAYTPERDGFAGTASLLSLSTGFAGMTSLPDGSVVFATSGTAADEGRFDVYNLTMPGVRGLAGSRSYQSTEGSFTVPAADAADPLPPGIARVDTVEFEPVAARHVRLQGVTPAPTYGYSVFELQVRNGQDGANLAVGRPTTASSFDTGKEPQLATDGSLTTRWAVSRADRLRPDSWLAVDLGSVQDIDRATVYWEAAAGRAYRIQTSTDGTTWTDRAEAPAVHRTTGWLGIDDRVGLLVRGSTNPITVAGDTITLSAGPAAGSAGMVVEGHPSVPSAELPALAARPAPEATDTAVRAALLAGHLSLFNLSAQAVETTVALAEPAARLPLYQGIQTVTADGTTLQISLPAASAQVLPARMFVTTSTGQRPPAGLRIELVDAVTVRLSGASATLRLESATGDHRVGVAVTAERTVEVTLPGTAYPVADLALGAITYPTSPLPPGMTSPAAAVDGSDATAWTVPGAGRMVVDLGSSRSIGEVQVDWVAGPPGEAQVELSTDGLHYTPAGTVQTRGRHGSLDVRSAARFVALTVAGRGSSSRGVSRFAVIPA